MKYTISSSACFLFAVASTTASFTLNDRAEATLASALGIFFILGTLKLTGTRAFQATDSDVVCPDSIKDLE